MNRFSISALVVAILSILSSAAFAADPAPQTAPAASGPARVAVLPFTPSGPDSQPWISDALQRAIVADLSRINTLSPVSLDKPNDDAIAKSGARYVVTGSYQLIGNELRFVGQVKELATDKPIAGLKATGSLRDLFALEDQISTQVNRALGRATGAQMATTEAAPVAIEPSGPLTMRTYEHSSLKDSVENPNDANYYRNQYVYNTAAYAPYAYPYYSGYGYGYNYADYGYYPQPYLYSGYGYGGFGGSVIVVNNNNRHFHGGKNFDCDGNFHDGNNGGRGNFNDNQLALRGGGQNFVNLPRGNIMTPQQATRGVGNVNGAMPMTLRANAVPRNFNNAQPMTMQSGGMARNFNAGTPMTMRSR